MTRVRLQRIMGNEAGFTLIELLAVAVILVVLSLMALPVYADASNKLRESKSADDLRSIEVALEAYNAQRGHYPSRLGILVEKGFMKPTAFETPWSSPDNRIYYLYAVDKEGTDVATRYVLGDPGPDANCNAAHLVCGNHPKSHAPVHQDLEAVWKLLANPLLRKASH